MKKIIRGKRSGRSTTPGGRLFWLPLLLLLVSCAPVTLYSVDLKYEPAKPPSREGKAAGITVAAFNDVRKVEDTLVIGKVVKPDGTSVPVVPKYSKPVDAVTAGMKDYLARAGYTVLKETPEWNLQERAIKKEWGKILVGGSIDDLQVVCRLSLPMKKYEAKVKLTVLFADPEKGKVFYKTTVESSSSREDISFSEEEMGEQISGALTEAIEKAFDNQPLKQKTRKTTGR